jgi:hypothetical protein
MGDKKAKEWPTHSRIPQMPHGDNMAKMVARLLAIAAFWVRIQTSLKNTKNGRQKSKGVGQHTLARQKIYQKNF